MRFTRNDALAYGVLSDFGRKIEDFGMERDLAKASQNNQVTLGAVGPQLQENLDQVTAARDAEVQRQVEAGADPVNAAAKVGEQYAPAMQELQRRIGLKDADYNVGRRSFTDQNEADQYAAGLNRQDMAGVYNRYGKPEAAMDLQNKGLRQEAAQLELNSARRKDKVEGALADAGLGNAVQDAKNKFLSGQIKGNELQAEILRQGSAMLAGPNGDKRFLDFVNSEDVQRAFGMNGRKFTRLDQDPTDPDKFTMVDADGAQVPLSGKMLEAQSAKLRGSAGPVLGEVAPGASLYDKKTGRILATAPEKEKTSDKTAKADADRNLYDSAYKKSLTGRYSQDIKGNIVWANPDDKEAFNIYNGALAKAWAAEKERQGRALTTEEANALADQVWGQSVDQAVRQRKMKGVAGTSASVGTAAAAPAAGGKDYSTLWRR